MYIAVKFLAINHGVLITQARNDEKLKYYVFIWHKIFMIGKRVNYTWTFRL